ncbi:hypothetical protein [Oceanobacillus jordanicus]|uniref:Sporulation protein Cse60 n=1 Tax=Oceanobacillus jordanicus TaxID=2867266 RepID=A0AAW5B6J5_9BACI|nr:hypothetical protein [Oceanobacillus jordanicus]MCG3418991.1 hypothetical protein [Oceanobacillus jordanicus]
MDLGVAGSIGVKQISGEIIDAKINEWLVINADVEVIDIKFSASANEEEMVADALIIYRRES